MTPDRPNATGSRWTERTPGAGDAGGSSSAQSAPRSRIVVSTASRVMRIPTLRGAAVLVCPLFGGHTDHTGGKDGAGRIRSFAGSAGPTLQQQVHANRQRGAVASEWKVGGPRIEGIAPGPSFHATEAACGSSVETLGDTAPIARPVRRSRWCRSTERVAGWG